MTAASRHLSPSAFLSRRLERIALALVVCVPIPTLALSGLAIPLPSVVERIGASLVPWAHVASLDTDTLAASGRRGSIVLTANQRGARASEPESTGATGRTTAPAARPQASRPLASRMSAAPAARANASPTATPETAPREPATPQGDGGGTEGPSTPAPTTPAEPTGGTGTSQGGGGAVTPTPAPAPTVDDVPKREPKQDVDVKPADEPDAKPADETDGAIPSVDVTPTLPTVDTGVPDADLDLPDAPSTDLPGNVNGNGDGGVGNGNGHSNGGGASERGSGK
jgi:hypothetical protein